MRSLIVAVFVSFVNVTTAFAEVFDTDWKMMNVKEFEDLQISGKDVRVNNFIVSQGTNFMYGKAQVLELSVSAINRSTERRNVSIQIIGLKSDGKPAFAMSAEPNFSMVQPGKSEDIKRRILINGNPITDAAQYLVRIIIN